MKIEGHRALISYMGQPMTCYGCNEPGYQIRECPHRRTTGSHETDHATNTWVNIVKRGRESVEDYNTGENTKANFSHTSDVQQDDELQSRDRENESPKDDEPMVVGDLESSKTGEATPPVVNVNKSNENSRMEAEETKEAIDEQRKYEIEPKWNRNAVNDAEVERDFEKEKKRKEKTKTKNKKRKKRNK